MRDEISLQYFSAPVLEWSPNAFLFRAIRELACILQNLP
jgi:hypothetical protein